MYNLQTCLTWLRRARGGQVRENIIMRLRQGQRWLAGRRIPRHVLFFLVALALLAGGLLWPDLRLAALILDVFLVTSWPWVWPHLKKSVLPRMLSVGLAELQATQKQQQAEVEWLATCLLHQCLQGSELHYLHQLAADEAFLLGKPELTGRLLADLRHLYVLGLIDRVADRGFRTFLEAVQGQTGQGYGVDVKVHFYITDRGKKYLALLQSELTALLSDS